MTEARDNPLAVFALVALGASLYAPVALGNEPPLSDEAPAIDERQRDKSASASVEASVDTEFTPAIKLEDGNQAEVGTVGIRIDGNVRRNRFSANIGAGYETRNYSAADDSLRLSATQFTVTMGYQGDAVGVFVGPILSIAGEPGADVGESITGGGVAGVTWLVNDKLLVGAGVFMSSQLEGVPQILPMPIFDWRPIDQLRVTSFGRYGPGGSIEVVGTPHRVLELSAGFTYRNQQFRLDSEGVAADGVFQTTGVPVWFGVGVLPTDWMRIDTYVGTTFAGSIDFFEADGTTAYSADYDPNVTLGLSISVELDAARSNRGRQYAQR